jgi:hypothetical protein
MSRLLLAFSLIAALATLSCLESIPSPEIEEKPPVAPAAYTLGGIRPVTGETRKETTLTTDFLGVISWTPSVPEDTTDGKFKFEHFRDYRAVISLAMLGGRSLPPAGTTVTVEGALSATYDASAGTITADFPRTHYPVDSVADLNTAIADLKNLSSIDYTVNKNIFELTTNFYSTTNSANTFITIGVSDIDNAIPCTIRGLGNDGKEELTVGVLLANNNITLEDLRVNITCSSKGVPHQWGDSTSNSFYRSAVSIGRYKSAVTNKADEYDKSIAKKPIRNVTIRNCNINFEASDSMLAGIFIYSTRDYQTENVSIANNTISVDTQDGTSAAQAILVYRYDPSLSITNNGLKSKNTPFTPLYKRPAGALFMQIDPDIDSAHTPRISGNMINGSPTYDFYINIFSKGDRIGVQELIDNKFATPESTWMTAGYSPDPGSPKSFYKKLIETLLPQTRGGLGYGYLYLYLGGKEYSAADCVFEAYFRENNRLSAIDFWGYTITNSGGYNESNSGANEVRARLLIDKSGNVTDDNAQFYWSPSTKGENITQSATP